MVKYHSVENVYSIKLPVFEGPMDLLLHLIKEQKLDIYDIPIALITRQYLEYLEMMKELNLEIAGEFLLMAATLIHIKSRMLLPVEETADTEESEDPRLELVLKLLEYKAFKDAALGLREREDEWSEVFFRTEAQTNSGEPEAGKETELTLFDLNLFDLMEAFKKVLDRAPEEIRAITRETLTIRDKMSIIIESLQEKEALRFEELFKDDILKSHFVVTFVALLELIRLGLAKVYQEKEFGTIWIINPERTQGYFPEATVQEDLREVAPGSFSPCVTTSYTILPLPSRSRLPRLFQDYTSKKLPVKPSGITKPGGKVL